MLYIHTLAHSGMPRVTDYCYDDDNHHHCHHYYWYYYYMGFLGNFSFSSKIFYHIDKPVADVMYPLRTVRRRVQGRGETVITVGAREPIRPTSAIYQLCHFRQACDPF